MIKLFQKKKFSYFLAIAAASVSSSSSRLIFFLVVVALLNFAVSEICFFSLVGRCFLLVFFAVSVGVFFSGCRVRIGLVLSFFSGRLR